MKEDREQPGFEPRTIGVRRSEGYRISGTGRAFVFVLVAGLAGLAVRSMSTQLSGAAALLGPDAGPPQAAEGFRWYVALHGPIAFDSGDDLAIDEDGTVFIAGSHSGLDPDRDGRLDLEADDSDLLFMKLTQRLEDDGLTLEWMRSPMSPGFDRGMARIAPDRHGGLYGSGQFRETLALGPDLSFSSRGKADGFLVRYDAHGVALWARTFGGPEGDQLFDVASDATGNAYVVGQAGGSFPLDEGGAEFRSPGGIAALIASYDPEGRLRWVRVLPPPIWIPTVEVAPDGEVVIVGQAETALDFDADGQAELPAPSDRDGFVARFDVDGRFLGGWWVGAGLGRIGFGTNGDVLFLGVVGGRVEERFGPADFDDDGVPDTRMKGEGPTGAALARYGRDGTLRWVRSYALEIPSDVEAAGERIALTGSYHGVRDLDEDGEPEPVDRTVDPSLEAELAILILSEEDGRPEHAWTAPGPGRDHANAAGFLPDHSTLFVTGSIELTADFSGDGEDGEGWAMCEARGDLFYARYGLAEVRGHGVEPGTR